MRFEDIEEQRRLLGLTQRALCAASGVNCMTYTAVKRGYRKPNMRTIEKLEAGLNQMQERQAGDECNV